MRLLLLSTFLLFGVYSYSQENNFSIGIQTNYPTKGLSLRYDLNNRSQFQLSYTIFKDFFVDRSLYGGKYSYYFKTNKSFIEPYSYIGVMLMKYNVERDFLDGNGTTFSYGIGGGIQSTLFKRIGVSVEGGYGKYNFNKSNEDFGFVGGFGLHYFFKRKD